MDAMDVDMCASGAIPSSLFHTKFDVRKIIDELSRDKLLSLLPQINQKEVRNIGRARYPDYMVREGTVPHYKDVISLLFKFILYCHYPNNCEASIARSSQLPEYSGLIGLIGVPINWNKVIPVVLEATQSFGEPSLFPIPSRTRCNTILEIGTEIERDILDIVKISDSSLSFESVFENDKAYSCPDLHLNDTVVNVKVTIKTHTSFIHDIASLLALVWLNPGINDICIYYPMVGWNFIYSVRNWNLKPFFDFLDYTVNSMKVQSWDVLSSANFPLVCREMVAQENENLVNQMIENENMKEFLRSTKPGCHVCNVKDINVFAKLIDTSRYDFPIQFNTSAFMSCTRHSLSLYNFKYYGIINEFSIHATTPSSLLLSVSTSFQHGHKLGILGIIIQCWKGGKRLTSKDKYIPKTIENVCVVLNLIRGDCMAILDLNSMFIEPKKINEFYKQVSEASDRSFGICVDLNELFKWRYDFVKYFQQITDLLGPIIQMVHYKNFDSLSFQTQLDEIRIFCLKQGIPVIKL